MKNSLPLLVFAQTILNACQQSPRPDQLRMINEGFENAATMLEQNNSVIYQQLDDKLKDSATHHRATTWLFKTNNIRTLSVYLKKYIDSLKSMLRNSPDANNENNTQVVIQIFTRGNYGYLLYPKLVNYRQELFYVVKSIHFLDNPFLQERVSKDLQEIRKRIPLLYGSNDSTIALPDEEGIENWIDSNFRNTGSLVAIAILNKIKNDVLLTENALINYSNLSVVSNFCGYTECPVANNAGVAYGRSGVPSTLSDLPHY